MFVVVSNGCCPHSVSYLWKAKIMHPYHFSQDLMIPKIDEQQIITFVFDDIFQFLYKLMVEQAKPSFIHNEDYRCQIP